MIVPLPVSPEVPESVLLYASQRRSTRHAVELECTVVRARDGQLVGTRGIDLSPDGMLLFSEVELLTGEPLALTFRLPGTSTWLDGEGVAARVVHGRRADDPGRAVGIAFESLDDGARRAIQAALDDLPEPEPAREPRIDYAASADLVALS